MLISIIIPVLNQVNFLEQTIQSFLSQSYPHKELILIDGGSTDGTKAIIEKYAPHFAYYEIEADQGQAHAINKGIARSKGQIINWLNADDYLMPDALKKIAQQFTQNPNLEVLCGTCIRTQEEATVGLSQTSLKPTVEETIVWPSMGQPSQFYARIVFDRIGNLNQVLHYSFDKEFWIKYLLFSGQKKVTVVADCYTVFRLHPAAKTTLSPELFIYEDKQIVQNIMQHKYATNQVNITILQGYLYGKETCSNYERRNYSLARQNALKTIATYNIEGKGFIITALKVLLLPNFMLNLFRSLFRNRK